MGTPRVFTAKIIVEPGDGPLEKLLDYVLGALSNVFRRNRDGYAMIVVYDENGKLLTHGGGGDRSSTIPARFAQFFEEIARPKG